MVRALPLACLLVASALAATPLPPAPAGTIPMVTTRERAKLQLTRGGATELKPGTPLELIEIDEKTATARVRFRNAEGTVPLRAIAEERPVSEGAAQAVPTPVPPPPPHVAAGATAQQLTAADLAKLPPEVQKLIREAKAEAARADPASVPAAREYTHTTSTPWTPSSPNASGTKPDLPAGSPVTPREVSTEVQFSPSPAQQKLRFKSEAEAQAYARSPAAQAEVAARVAAQRAKAEAEMKAKAEEIARREAAKQRPPDAK